MDLGTIEPNEDSVPHAINSLGEVVGVSGGIIGHPVYENKCSKSFYWSESTGMLNVNSMIPEESGWNIVWVKDINDLGQIVAYAIKDGESHIVILHPLIS